MRYFITALILLIAVPASAQFKEAVLITSFKQVCHTVTVPVEVGTTIDPETGEKVPVYEDVEQEVCEEALELDTPCPIYHYTLKSLGKDVTYGKYKFANKGLEVLAYIHVKDEDKTLIKEHEGYIGDDWEDVKNDIRYLKHYNVTKADYLATSVPNELTQEVMVIKYAEKDKDEIVTMYPCMLSTDYVKKLSVIEKEMNL